MPTKIIIKSNQAKLLKKKNHTQTYIYIYIYILKAKNELFFGEKTSLFILRKTS